MGQELLVHFSLRFPQKIDHNEESVNWNPDGVEHETLPSLELREVPEASVLVAGMTGMHLKGAGEDSEAEDWVPEKALVVGKAAVVALMVEVVAVEEEQKVAPATGLVVGLALVAQGPWTS